MDGSIIQLDVTNIAHGGVCVARHEGRVVFVSDAIPGETVLARVSESSKKSFWRAETVSALSASPFRQPHVWAAASIDREPDDRAGGAEFGHITLAHQRELKRQVLADSLARMAHVNPLFEVEAAEGDNERSGTGWRTRVGLHVDDQGRLGPFAARSHRVIPVHDLPLATDELAAAVPWGDRFLGHERLDLLVTSSGSSPSHSTVRIRLGDQKSTTITEWVGEREFLLADNGFWQVHREAASTLTSAVQQAIDVELFDPTAPNLDLYGGVGMLAAAVCDRFGPRTRITTVESDSAASEYAAENLRGFIEASAATGRVERWLRMGVTQASGSEASRMRKATVILDPPRSGAGRDVIQNLGLMKPAQMIYVACDPVALARDTEFLAHEGYRLASVRAFDLFPNTHHLEAVAQFVSA